jgi:hypothetical protein
MEGENGRATAIRPRGAGDQKSVAESVSLASI